MQTDKLIDRVQDILRDVGATLMVMRAKGPVGGTWHATQLKSEADLIAEAMIMRGLRALTPSLPVVSEEDLASHAVDRFSRYWLVDPIDGTASFCGGYSGFVTQLALMDGARPVLGAVYGPALDLMYVAEQGGGANANGARLAVDWQGGDMVLIDNYPKPRGITGLLHEKLPCAGYVESGSIGLKICRVADGQADLFVKDVTVRDWDLAPGHLILREAGGVLVDLNGREIDYGGDLEQSGGLIASASSTLVARVTNFLKG
ncbi:MAG: 3'(2'),5'-bisphosphate nucleotidase CysQ [Sulfuritalea sp.]|nr:3'(2'),5'-bisphosphate nucleotidase CysQ [Sulfuritalea sp.]